MKKILTPLVLLAILIIASYYRFSGSSPGYPPYHSDEGISYSAAVSMIKNENLDPLRYDYPAVVPLTNYVSYRFFFIPLSWGEYYLSNINKFMDGLVEFPLDETTKKRVFQTEILGERERNALSWGRLTTAFIGLGIVLLVYKIGKELFEDTAIGLLAALFTAFNYRHVLNSHIGLPDIYNSFFMLLSLLYSTRLLKNPTSKRYFLASVFAGLSFSAKYQVFSFIPLLIVHLYLSFKEKGWDKRLKALFRKEALAVPFVAALIFVVLNPYLFIKIEETIDWLLFVASKYRTDKNSLDFFPLSYLYHIGIGSVTSVLVLFGIVVGFVKKPKNYLLIFSIIFFFFLVTIYMTGGGFYTRNFVTIIPFLLLSASVGVVWLLKLKPRFIFLPLALILVFLSVNENSVKANLVARQYRGEWNIELLTRWIEDNISPESKVAAHSSVRFSDRSIVRIPFEQKISFSIDEFIEKEADFAIMNLDWVTNDFYWWMTQDTKTSLEYWDKPINELEESYPALAIREFSDYSIFSVTNSAFAPDSNFVAAKIPRRTISGVETEGIEILKQETKVKGFARSEVIEIDGSSGLVVEYEVKTVSKNVNRDGFVFVEFYQSKADAELQKNRLAVRVSSRNFLSDEYTDNQFAAKAPTKAKYAVVGFGVYQKSLSQVYFDKATVYKANIEEDFDGSEVRKVELDTGIVFPNSHGNL